MNLKSLVAEHHTYLRDVVARESGAVLRFESLDDVVGDVQTELLARQDRFEYRGHPQFRAYLKKAATHYLRNRAAHYRAERRILGKRVPMDECPLLEEGLACEALEPSALVEQEERWAQLAHALDKLTFAELELVLALDAPLSELARQYGTSAEAIGKRRQRALARLRHFTRRRACSREPALW